MIQVWNFDNNNVYTNGGYIKDEKEFDNKTMTKVPYGPKVGFIKPTFDGEKWVEGATTEEIEASKTATEEAPILEERVASLEEMIVMLTE